MRQDTPSTVPPATRTDWYWGPANRWSWRNMRRLFPTARVGRGEDGVSPLPRADRDLGAIAFEDPAAGPSTLEGFLNETFTDGFMVLKDGAILYERYFNGMSPRETHLLMSVTKSVTGALIGILAEQGRVALDVPIERYLPELASTSFGGASLQQLIDMQVARPADPSYDRIDQAAGWIEGDDGGGLLAYLRRPGSPIGPHGRRFVYLTENTTLAGVILERATGKDLARLLEEEIWSKLGAEADADLLLDAHQTAFASPGLNATLRDMARFAGMMLQGGRWNGRQIIPEAWVRDIRLQGSRAAWSAGMSSEDIPAFQKGLVAAPGYGAGSYRSFWWVSDPAVGRFSAIGLGAQTLILDPATQMAVVKLSSPPNPMAGAAATLSLFHLADALAAELA